MKAVFFAALVAVALPSIAFSQETAPTSDVAPFPEVSVTIPEILQSEEGEPNQSSVSIQIACQPGWCPICTVNEVCDSTGCVREEYCFCGLC